MLVDTSGLLCLVHRSEPRHLEAREFFRQIPKKLIHNYILDEFVALAHARKFQREATLSYSEAWLTSSTTELIWVDESLHRSGLKLLQTRLDKNYSLCDAVSFVLMREHGITDALTTDRHFEQEGFIRLLRP